MTLSVVMPIRTGRGLNDRLHWAAKAEHKRKERNTVRLLWPWKRRQWAFPLRVHLVRLSPATRPMDDDGVVAALKHVRDQVADELGVDDGDTAHIRFTYSQERAPWGVRIELQAVATLPF